MPKKTKGEKTMANPEVLKNGMNKKELHLFFVLDTSGSMQGQPIAQLNEGMSSTMNILKDKFTENVDVDMKIAVLEYNSGAQWRTGGVNHLEDMQDFVEYTDLEARGMTYLGAALDMLNEGLSRNTMMKSATGNKCPIIIFLSDGYPTDDWRSALERIKGNKWYQQAIKIGIALGERADSKMLGEVVGTEKNVLTIQETGRLAEMIQILSVTASLAGSVSQTGRVDAEKIIEETEKQMNGEESADVETEIDSQSDSDFDDDSFFIDDDELI